MEIIEKNLPLEEQKEYYQENKGESLYRIVYIYNNIEYFIYFF